MADKDEKLTPQLWTHRPVTETIRVYADWAETYERDIKARGYHTPDRIAAALLDYADPDALILDFGCGTGLAAVALRKVGYNTLHGTDVTAEMLAQAERSGLYEKTWLSTPDTLGFEHGDYGVIVAAGVISLGAGPPELIAPLVDKLASGGLLAFSFNDPTLADDSYTKALEDVISSGCFEMVFRENGPHLDDVNMKSDVMVLRRL